MSKKIYLKVKPRSSQSKVEKVSDNIFHVWVKAAPEKGRANKEVVQVLADYFGVSKTNVHILKGETTRMKLVEIG
ncbi:DUF167 domain-containing protein [Patescibacteria group bacterium]|nr:DUF167 domain-containing protein [Patescibacteria group bacterium]